MIRCAFIIQLPYVLNPVINVRYNFIGSTVNYIDSIKKYIFENHQGSEFSPVPESWIKDIEKKYPNMPKDLKEIYAKIGYGSIGDSLYMIHALLEPSEIYDEETASDLDGVVIVGDDFSGNCSAYDAKNGWVFGCIECGGEFESFGKEIQSFSKYLEYFYCNPDLA